MVPISKTECVLGKSRDTVKQKSYKPSNHVFNVAIQSITVCENKSILAFFKVLGWFSPLAAPEGDSLNKTDDHLLIRFLGAKSMNDMICS